VELVERAYERLARGVEIGRRRLGRPLTLAEKILFGHLDDAEHQEVERSVSYAGFRPDRVAMQDATAQMALLQFMTAGLDRVAVPTTVHCDHLIQASEGAANDLRAAEVTNREVYDFLSSISARYGIGFWKPGSGIIHQVVLEQYAFPGGMMIGTDSHTPNAGGLSMVAIGVGGADAVDVMVGDTFDVRYPKIIGVKLTGEVNGWTSAKDVILRVAEVLTVKGGTGAIIEYFGSGARSLSTTGRATICNMGAEVGATCSLFPFDAHSVAYLKSTGREAIADLAQGQSHNLEADPEVERDPERYFDRVIEIDLSTLEPHIVGPHTPDRGRPVSEMAEEVRANGWPMTLSSTLVGSCTNSSYEDIARAAHVARQARAAGLSVRVPLLVTPGSERVHQTILRDGLLGDLEAIGATVLANACGPCIGQWKRSDVVEGDVNAILSSYNRNFPRRNDGFSTTLSFIASPETVVAYALAGTLAFNPLTDEIDGVRLSAPFGDELPSQGFESGDSGFIEPPSDGRSIDVVIAPDSERLERLEPFEPWSGEDFVDLTVLMKAVGKCTTDHISAAGPWLRYRGHLSNISKNLFISVVNAYGSKPGLGFCQIHESEEPLPEIAAHYRAAARPWIAIGDENYGEGSSREHAALEPRFMGAKAILARSFARIHESNLKKQGLLPLTFADPDTYDLIGRDDTISILGLADLAPGSMVRCEIHRLNGTVVPFTANHTMSENHIAWFRAGSALNVIRSRQGS
jgi:aconitate hydratase